MKCWWGGLLLMGFFSRVAFSSCEGPLVVTTDAELKELFQRSSSLPAPEAQHLRWILRSRLAEYRDRFFNSLTSNARLVGEKLWQQKLREWEAPTPQPSTLVSSSHPVVPAFTDHLEDIVRDLVWESTGHAAVMLFQDDTILCHQHNPRLKLCPEEELTNVVSVVAGRGSFSALLADGSVRCWGPDPERIAQCRGLTGLKSITAAQEGYAGVTTDGKVKCWGTEHGPVDCSKLRDVDSIVANTGQFMILYKNGTVDAWWHHEEPNPHGFHSEKFFRIFSNSRNFIGLRANGTVFCWANDALTQWCDGLRNIVSISAAGQSIVALDAEGHAFCVGDDTDTFGCQDLKDVRMVASSKGGHFAIKKDGTQWAWGRLPEAERPQPLDQVRMVLGHDHGFLIQDASGNIYFMSNSFEAEAFRQAIENYPTKVLLKSGVHP